MAAAGVRLFPHGTATPQGGRRSLPKSSASGWGLAAWGSMPDPQPGVLAAGAAFSLLSVLAGSGEQQGKQPGWNSDSGRGIRVYGGTHPPEEGMGPATHTCSMGGGISSITMLRNFLL